MYRSGGAWPARREAQRSSLAAEPDGSRCRWRGRVFRSSGSIVPRPCSAGRPPAPGPCEARRRGRERRADTRSRRHSRPSISCRPICAGARAVRGPAVSVAGSRSRCGARVRLAGSEGRGTFGLDLVPDVPNWREYRNQIQLRGPAAPGTHLTLVESVRQDRRRRLTTFEQRYLERRAGRTVEHRFELTFRTLPVRAMVRRLEAAGFVVEATLGDYRGQPWDPRSEVWLILARKTAHNGTRGILRTQ